MVAGMGTGMLGCRRTLSVRISPAFCHSSRVDWSMGGFRRRGYPLGTRRGTATAVPQPRESHVPTAAAVQAWGSEGEEELRPRYDLGAAAAIGAVARSCGQHDGARACCWCEQRGRRWWRATQGTEGTDQRAGEDAFCAASIVPALYACHRTPPLHDLVTTHRPQLFNRARSFKASSSARLPAWLRSRPSSLRFLFPPGSGSAFSCSFGKTAKRRPRPDHHPRETRDQTLFTCAHGKESICM